jgi:hypothetical protein
MTLGFSNVRKLISTDVGASNCITGAPATETAHYLGTAQKVYELSTTTDTDRNNNTTPQKDRTPEAECNERNKNAN